MAISLTSEAAEHVGRQLQSRGKGEGIRIGVKTSGCSGLAYVLEFVDQPEPEDTIFESDGVKVFVDPKSLVYLNGTIVDFAREGLNEGLEFRNPNVDERDAKRLFPKERWNDLHLQIIWYGREYCPARGWAIENDEITLKVGRKSVLKNKV